MFESWRTTTKFFKCHFSKVFIFDLIKIYYFSYSRYMKVRCVQCLCNIRFRKQSKLCRFSGLTSVDTHINFLMKTKLNRCGLHLSNFFNYF